MATTPRPAVTRRAPARVPTRSTAPATQTAPARPAATPPRRAATAPATPAPAMNMARLNIEYIDITDIVPYEWNPRQNADAVASVAASMRLTQGFAMPVVVDANNVLIAGHTRIEAAKSLGMAEAPVVRLSHLSPEIVNAFRVIDNKVSEQAKWDYDLLAGEIGKLADAGLDFTEYGWAQADLDCMSQMVASDCLSVETLVPVANEAVETARAGIRGPQSARFVLGEHVFFIPMEVYRVWSNGINQLHSFDKDAIAEEIQRRLGIAV